MTFGRQNPFSFSFFFFLFLFSLPSETQDRRSSVISVSPSLSKMWLLINGFPRVSFTSRRQSYKKRQQTPSTGIDVS